MEKAAVADYCAMTSSGLRLLNLGRGALSLSADMQYMGGGQAQMAVNQAGAMTANELS